MLPAVKTPYAVHNPAKLMANFAEAGNDTLLQLRENLNSPENRKKPRTWGTIEAAQLVGISPGTLNKMLKPNLPGLVEDDDKHKRWKTGFTLEAINILREMAGTRYKRPAGSAPIKTAVTNLKGGVGKTETAVDLAKKSAIEGVRTLLIDTDAQGSATLLTTGLIPDIEIQPENTIRDVLLKNPALIKSAIMKTNFDGLDIIPANLAIQDCDLILPNPAENNQEELGPPIYRLAKALEYITTDYDLIIIDCGPNLGALTLNVIMACNALVVPIPPNIKDYSSFLMYASTLSSLFEDYEDKQLDYFRILISRHPDKGEAKHMEDLIREQFTRYVLKNTMCETIEVPRTSNEIGTIYDVVKRPTRTMRESYDRALQSLDKVNMEIIGDFKEIWDAQGTAYQADNFHLQEVVNE